MEAGQLITPTIKLVRLLGKGGMGEVWAAEHQALGTLVAVKLMSPKYADDNDSVLRFRQEAQSAARIKSPHATSFFDYGLTEIEQTTGRLGAGVKTENVGGIRAIAMNPADKTLATSESGRRIALWGLTTGERLQVSGEHRQEVLALAFDNHAAIGSQLAAGWRYAYGICPFGKCMFCEVVA